MIKLSKFFIVFLLLMNFALEAGASEKSELQAAINQECASAKRERKQAIENSKKICFRGPDTRPNSNQSDRDAWNFFNNAACENLKKYQGKPELWQCDRKADTNVYYVAPDGAACRKEDKKKYETEAVNDRCYVDKDLGGKQACLRALKPDREFLSWSCEKECNDRGSACYKRNENLTEISKLIIKWGKAVNGIKEAANKGLYNNDGSMWTIPDAVKKNLTGTSKDCINFYKRKGRLGDVLKVICKKLVKSEYNLDAKITNLKVAKDVEGLADFNNTIDQYTKKNKALLWPYKGRTPGLFTREEVKQERNKKEKEIKEARLKKEKELEATRIKKEAELEATRIKKEKELEATRIKKEAELEATRIKKEKDAKHEKYKEWAKWNTEYKEFFRFKYIDNIKLLQDPKSAFNKLEPVAKQGHPKSNIILAFMYANGHGTEQSWVKALERAEVALTGYNETMNDKELIDELEALKVLPKKMAALGMYIYGVSSWKTGEEWEVRGNMTNIKYWKQGIKALQQSKEFGAPKAQLWLDGIKKAVCGGPLNFYKNQLNLCN